MLTVRKSTRIAVVLGLIVALGALAGCASTVRSTFGTLPPDLPEEPEPCTTYCKVWVPPVYRDVPKLVTVRPPCTVSEPETICRTQLEEVCVKPRTNRICKSPAWKCEQAVVQTRPGGYKWKQDGAGCWKYCYEEPCYQWCSKRVTEGGIEYCVEDPPEYRVVAHTEEATVLRQRCLPGEYKTVWTKEVYVPGHWEWQPKKSCLDCDCPGPCPTIPRKKRPCKSLAMGVPRCN
jgi:hypothetical protein